MTIKLWCASLLAILPAASFAQSLAHTHEQVSVPGKAIVAYRPLAQRAAVSAKCHPEASKAIACEAQAAASKRNALAAHHANKPAQLSQR